MNDNNILLRVLEMLGCLIEADLFFGLIWGKCKGTMKVPLKGVKDHIKVDKNIKLKI